MRGARLNARLDGGLSEKGHLESMCEGGARPDSTRRLQDYITAAGSHHHQGASSSARHRGRDRASTSPSIVRPQKNSRIRGTTPREGVCADCNTVCALGKRHVKTALRESHWESRCRRRCGRDTRTSRISHLALLLRISTRRSARYERDSASTRNCSSRDTVGLARACESTALHVAGSERLHSLLIASQRARLVLPQPSVLCSRFLHSRLHFTSPRPKPRLSHLQPCWRAERIDNQFKIDPRSRFCLLT